MSSTLQPVSKPAATLSAANAPSAPRVKICGITNLVDAELALDLGAWTLGMIFYDGSPRRCSLEQALQITTAMRRKVELCGVFVNASLEEIERTSEELGLTMVQLHGDEGPSFCEEVRRRTGALIVKAAQVAGPGDVRDLERFHVDYHLLDTRSLATARQGMRGGTGESFDWELASVRRSSVPLILSGGLSAANVAEAIAITHPYAIDSASATESAPGHKNPEKLRALFAAVGATQPEPPVDARQTPPSSDSAQIEPSAQGETEQIGDAA
jgi:phosphoribosylanthranilate isomerase